MEDMASWKVRPESGFTAGIFAICHSRKTTGVSPTW